MLLSPAFPTDRFIVLRLNLSTENLHDLLPQLSSCGEKRDCVAAADAGNPVHDLSNQSVAPLLEHALWIRSETSLVALFLVPTLRLGTLQALWTPVDCLVPVVTGSERYELASAPSHLLDPLEGQLLTATR